MKQRSAAFLLIAAVLEASVVACLVIGQYGLALEIIAFACLLVWAVLAFCGRELFGCRTVPLDPLFSERVAERHARYGIYALPVASDTIDKRRANQIGRGMFPLFFATLAAATVLGAALGFAFAGNMAMAAAITGSAGMGALALYCCHGETPSHESLQRRLDQRIRNR